MNEIDNTVERLVGQLPDARHLVPCDHLDCDIDGGLDTDGVKKLVAAYTKAVADNATAKQGLEHYADELNWMIGGSQIAVPRLTNLYTPVDDKMRIKKAHGYTVAQQKH